MHVYALVHQSEAAIALPEGIAGPLAHIHVGEIAAIVEPALTLEQVQQSDQTLLQAVLAHDRILRHLFAQTTLLPLRFTAFPELETLQADLRDRQADCVAQLAQLAGKAEYTLKWIPLDGAQPAIAPPAAEPLRGKDYFLAKKRQLQDLQQHQQEQTAQLQQGLAAIARTYPQHQIMSPSPAGQTLHLLANRAAEPDLQHQFEQWQQHSPLWQLSLSEALPPYHFCALDSESA
jgi:hypothetical protein